MPTPLEVLNMMREDCQNDAEGLDGQAFSGLSVGTQLGNILAMIDTLAALLIEQLEDQ